MKQKANAASNTYAQPTQQFAPTQGTQHGLADMPLDDDLPF